MPANAGTSLQPNEPPPYRPNYVRKLVQDGLLLAWGAYTGYCFVSAVGLALLIHSDHSRLVVLSDGDKVAHVLRISGVFTFAALDPPSGPVLIIGLALLLVALTVAAGWAWVSKQEDAQEDLDNAIARAFRRYGPSRVNVPAGPSQGTTSSGPNQGNTPS